MQKEMVENNLETEKCAFVGDSDIQGGNQGLRREPSFSGWCDENGITHSALSSDNADLSIEDSDFELPLLEGDRSEDGCLGGERQKFSKSKLRSMHINGGHSLDNTSYHIEGNGNERNYVPFDVENGSGSQPHGSASQGTHKTVSDTQSPISVVVVLKTLFFIVVWYSFSTCLTLYNKTLLGDDLGKFPAPMLMNTVHFGMQAVLSNAITWFWAKRFRPRVAMSWRDYFMRGCTSLDKLWCWNFSSWVKWD